MSKAISANSHDKRTSRTNDPTVSINCLTTRGHDESGVERKTRTGQP